MVRDYAKEAYLIGCELCDSGFPWYPDDLHDRIPMPDDKHEANGLNNIVGAVINRLLREKKCKRTGNRRQSRLPSRNGAYNPEYIGMTADERGELIFG